jgi:hypothetical protein
LIDVDRLRVSIQTRERKRKRQVSGAVVGLYFDGLLIRVHRLGEAALIDVNVTQTGKRARIVGRDLAAS